MAEIGTWPFRKMEQLLSLRYFQRAWVIQEIVLGRTVYLLVEDE
jgi:hypothetical protein